MAVLPHHVELKNTSAVLDQAQEWCHKQWPNTHQATWYSGPIKEPLTRRLQPSRIWSFQFKEDAAMFEVTWITSTN